MALEWVIPVAAAIQAAFAVAIWKASDRMADAAEDSNEIQGTLTAIQALLAAREEPHLELTHVVRPITGGQITFEVLNSGYRDVGIRHSSIAIVAGNQRTTRGLALYSDPDMENRLSSCPVVESGKAYTFYGELNAEEDAHLEGLEEAYLSITSVYGQEIEVQIPFLQGAPVDDD